MVGCGWLWLFVMIHVVVAAGMVFGCGVGVVVVVDDVYVFLVVNVYACFGCVWLCWCWFGRCC